jgi:hypothetical protein
VQIAIPDAEGATGLNSAPDEFSAETVQTAYSDRPSTIAGSTIAGRTTAGSAMNRRIAVRAALKAGLLGVFIGMIPLLGIVLTGALAVYFYRRESKFVLPVPLGARLGGAAGVVVFAINALFAVLTIVFHAQQEYIDDILKIAQRYGVNTDAPQFQASIHNLFTPRGLASFFIISLVLASIGGALASRFMRPRNTRV